MPTDDLNTNKHAPQDAPYPQGAASASLFGGGMAFSTICSMPNVAVQKDVNLCYDYIYVLIAKNLGRRPKKTVSQSDYV